MKHLAILLSLCTPLLQTGCGSSAPSEQQARAVVEGSQSRDLGKLADFRKLNAEAKEVEGQKVYVYHFLSALELPDGFAWRKGGLWKDPGPAGRKNPWMGDLTPLPKGATAVRRGTITFRFTDNGWVSLNAPDSDEWSYCADLKAEACYKKLGWDRLN